MNDESSGRYGEVLEHPLLRGLFWMVLQEGPVTAEWVGGTLWRHRNLFAVCIADDTGMAQREKVGSINVIAAKGWIIHE